MKYQKHSFLDDCYFRVVKALTDQLESREIDYALIGGCGVQAVIVNSLTKEGRISLTDVDNIESILRNTGDVDLNTNSDYAIMSHFFNEFQALNSWLEVRHGTTKTPVVKVAEAAISIGYLTSPKDFKGYLTDMQYYDQIETSEDLFLKRKNSSMRVRVAIPEYLVATKLVRGKDKDIIDIANLMSALRKVEKKVNSEQVRSILKSAKKERYFDRLTTLRYDLDME